MYNNNNMYDSYPMQNNKGVGTHRPTKSNVELFIATNLGITLDCVVFSTLSDRPKTWKHSCVRTGVTVLNERILNFYGVATIYFATCPYCNKIIYYVEG